MRNIERSNWEIREDAFRRHVAADESSRGHTPKQIEDPTSTEYQEYLREMYPVARDLLILFQRAGIDLVGTVQTGEETNIVPIGKLMRRQIQKEAK